MTNVNSKVCVKKHCNSRQPPLAGWASLVQCSKEIPHASIGGEGLETAVIGAFLFFCVPLVN